MTEPWVALFDQFTSPLPPGGDRQPPPFDGPALLAGAGFAAVTREHPQVELPMEDPGAMWEWWYQTHGTRRCLDQLGDDDRAEFRRRLAAGPVTVLHRAVLLHTARTGR